MKHIVWCSIVLFFITINLFGQKYRTLAISPEIHSIQVLANGDWNSYPVIRLGADDLINISFDKVSDDLLTRLRYKIIYCNADWTENTSLSDIEYLDGYGDNLIDNYSASVNTTVSYTNYNLQLPNRDVNFRISGNYAVLIYEEDIGEDELLMVACFSVLDKQVSIFPAVSTITDIDANSKHHQISFDLTHDFALRDAKNDLQIFVRQNNRLDSERKNVKPNFVEASKLRYTHNRDLIFEAGNEYHRFDISSRKSAGRNILNIEYRNPNYHVYLEPKKINKNGSYSYDQDQNGRVIYRTLDGDNVDNEGDYLYTYFSLASDKPLQEDIYINGAFTNNTFSEKYKMVYDEIDREYHLSLLLKQGLYNYQFLTGGESEFLQEEVDGSFYEAENEYSIYVYYRPPGQRYDSFVGFTHFQSRTK